MSSKPLPRLFVLGDSISIHYGPHLQAMLEGRFSYARKTGLEAALKDLDTPTGANGGDSSRCLQYLQAMTATGLDADVLLLNCGLHDVKHDGPDPRCQVTLSDYEANLRQIIALAEQLNVALLWVRTTPVDEAQHNTPESAVWRYNREVDAYNAAADRIMAEHQITSADLHALTQSLGPISETSHDGRHFTAPTQKAQAAYLAGFLEGWWARRPAPASAASTPA